MAHDHRAAALLGAGQTRKQEQTMPVLLWLLGMPIGLIIILMLIGVA